MPESSVVGDLVAAYLKAVATGSGAEIAAMYAPDATVEDPVGGPMRRGTAAIQEMYAAIENLGRETELLALKVAGSSAAFHFRVRTELPDQVVEVEPIDVMTFGEDGRITSMRAFWAPEDMRSIPR
jgi:steroid delta-isomerase